MADHYKIKIDASGIGQLTAETCWLASYKIVFRACGRPDGGIRRDMEQAGLPYADYYANGLPRSDYLKAREALKLESYFPSFIKGLADDASAMVSFLKSHGPIWCSIERKGKLHIIAVNGVDGKMKQIYALNPWSNISAGEVESMVIVPSDFKSWVTNDSGSCQTCPTWKPVPYNPSEDS